MDALPRQRVVVFGARDTVIDARTASALRASSSDACEVVPVPLAEGATPTPPPGRINVVVAAFSVVRPRTLLRANAILDACFHLVDVRFALLALDVDLVQYGVVERAHTNAGVPRVTCRDVVEYAEAKFAAMRGMRGDDDDDDRDATAAGLFASSRRIKKNAVAADIAMWATEPGPTHLGSTAAFPDVWDALAAAGAQRHVRKTRLPEWVTLAAADDPDGAAFANRRTREVTRTMPAAVATQSLAGGSSELSKLFGRAHRTVQAAPDRHLRDRAVAMAAAQRSREVPPSDADVDREAGVLDHGQVAADGTTPPRVRDERRLAELQRTVAQLQQAKHGLEANAVARRTAIADTQRQLDAEDVAALSVLNSESARNPVQTAKRQLAALEAGIAATKQRAQALATWQEDRRALTDAYLTAWRANKATRSDVVALEATLGGLQLQAEAVRRDDHAPLDVRLAQLEHRTFALDSDTQELLDVELPAARRDVEVERVRVDFPWLWQDGADNEAPSKAAVVYRGRLRRPVQTAAAALAGARHVGAACAAAEDDLVAGCDAIVRSAAAELARLAPPTDAAGRPVKDDADGPVSAKLAAMAELVRLDVGIARVMVAEATARQHLELAGSAALARLLVGRLGALHDALERGVAAANSKASLL